MSSAFHVDAWVLQLANWQRILNSSKLKKFAICQGFNKQKKVYLKFYNTCTAVSLWCRCGFVTQPKLVLAISDCDLWWHFQMLVKCTDWKFSYLGIYFQSTWPNDLKYVFRIFVQSYHVVLQKFRIQHDRILSIQRI